MQITHINLEDGDCLIRSCGQGTAVLLLHAGVADSRMWQPQFEGLCSHYKLIAPDLRGFGQSPLPKGAFSYQDDLINILAHFDISQWWIIGNSFGSYLAANFALKYPEKVKGLILLAPTVGGFETDEAIDDFQQGERQLLAAGDIEGATELNLKTWFDGPKRDASQLDPVLRQQLGEMQLDAFKQAEPEGVRILDDEIDEIDAYARIDCPVILIAGDQDQPAVLRHAADLNQILPKSQLEVLEGAGHLPSIEKPLIVNRMIRLALRK